MTVLEKIKRCVSLVWDFQEFYGEEDIEEFCRNELHTYPQHNEIMEYFKHIEELEKENELLGKRCNQLLKDKGNLTDELKNWKEEWQEQVQKAIDEGWERTKLTGRVRELEQQIEKMKCDVKQEQSRWNSCEMQYDLYQRLLDKWEIKENA